MNINEIEKLVGLIEKTTDTETKGLLKKLLATIVEKEGVLANPMGPLGNMGPLGSSITLTAPSYNVCTECGIDMDWSSNCESPRCPNNFKSTFTVNPHFTCNTNLTGC